MRARSFASFASAARPAVTLANPAAMAAPPASVPEYTASPQKTHPNAAAATGCSGRNIATTDAPTAPLTQVITV